MINEVKEYFIEKSNEYEKVHGYNYWENHVKYVVDIAKKLAEKNKADTEVVEISAILHDIAKVLEEEKEPHNIIGSKIAVQLLKNKKYNPQKIEQIRKCILYHNENIESVKLTKEEWCIRNADIISMFNNITIFFYLAYNEYKASYEDGKKMVKDMMIKKYNKLDSTLKIKYDKLFNDIFNSI